MRGLVRGLVPVARPVREPVAKPAIPKQRAQRRRANKNSGATLRFWIFASVVASLLVITVVALDSLLVQTDYAMRTSQLKVIQLQSDHDVLVNEVAQLSSPARIASWAAAHGLVEPKTAVILKIPGSGRRHASGGGSG